VLDLKANLNNTEDAIYQAAKETDLDNFLKIPMVDWGYSYRWFNANNIKPASFLALCCR